MTDYLARGDAPFSDELWSRLTQAVVASAKETLVARRFMPFAGPLGPGAAYAAIDSDRKQETAADGVAVLSGRALSQIPQLFEDFWLYWRDLAQAEQDGLPADINAARTAATDLAFREDGMVFYGVKELGIDGLLTAKGVQTHKKGDWNTGETAYTDVSSAIAMLLKSRRMSRHTLVVSQDIYIQLQHIVPGTGVMESTRLEKMLEGRLFFSPALQPGAAMLLSAEPQYMDLLVGQDIAVAYTEAVDLNHHLRVLETALPRVKAPEAIVVFK